VGVKPSWRMPRMMTWKRTPSSATVGSEGRLDIITDPNKPEELPAVRELTHHLIDAIKGMDGT